MLLNPKKISIFHKKARITVASEEDMQSLGEKLANAFSGATGLKRIGLIGEIGVGKTTLGQSWTKAANPLELHASHTIIDRPQTLWTNNDQSFWLRHYDASATRFVDDARKQELAGFGCYFRDVNQFGIDIVEHPEYDTNHDGNMATDFNYLMRMTKPSAKSEARKIKIFAASYEVQSDEFKAILEHSDNGYGYFQ